MNDILNKKKLELKFERQLVTTKIYIILLLLGIVGGGISTFTDPINSGSEIIEVSIILLVCISIISFLVVMQLIPRKSINDNYYVAFNIIIYALIVYLNPENPSITLSFWMASLIIVLVGTLNKRIFSVFLVMHILFNVIMIFRLPEYIMRFTLANYIEIISSGLIVLIGGYNIIKIYNKYEGALFEEYGNILRKNKEIQLLNQEYIDIDEELSVQYDEIYKLNSELRLVNEKLNIIYDITNDVIIDFDLDNNKYHFSSRADTIFSNIAGFLDGPFDKMTKLLTKEDKEKFEMILNKISKEIDLPYIEEFEFQKSVNDIKHISAVLLKYHSLITDTNHMIMSIHDISKRKMQEKTIYDLAYKDKITKLPNRDSFVDNLWNRMLLSDDMFYVIYIKINHYNSLKNVYGNIFAKNLLNRMKDILLDEKLSLSTVSSMGGEHFAAVIDSRRSLDELLNSDSLFSMTFQNEGLEIHIDNSIGVSAFTENQSALFVLRCAEVALDKAVKESLSFYIYDNTIDEELERKVNIAHLLQDAIKNDELYVVFQPIVNSIKNEVMGFESLARWQSKIYGNISPGEFITVAEEIGIIPKIEEHIIRLVCRFAKKLGAIHEDGMVSINISALELLDEKFSKKLIRLIEDEGISPKQIGIEITETIVIENIEVAKEHLSTLRNFGFKIYLDDFGTGYSSLNYLYELPIDVLKVDKSFVDNLSENNKKQLILKELIKLSEKLDIMCIIEGVETKEQLDLINQLGGNNIQGYHFSKPLKREDALVYKSDS
ncbi:MAG: GGDEF domain-containing protein [Clostridiales bacterium]|nr:GGDEF domain-containing protein [Clostridiales bacterium]